MAQDFRGVQSIRLMGPVLTLWWARKQRQQNRKHGPGITIQAHSHDGFLQTNPTFLKSENLPKQRFLMENERALKHGGLGQESVTFRLYWSYNHRQSCFLSKTPHGICSQDFLFVCLFCQDFLYPGFPIHSVAEDGLDPPTPPPGCWDLGVCHHAWVIHGWSSNPGLSEARQAIFQLGLYGTSIGRRISELSSNPTR